MRHKFDLGYKTWVHHGKLAFPPPPPVIDNTRQPQMSDMTALLNDLSYIPPNNEHNEPTQGDIGETSNEPNQATRNEFEELYASANEELYPGSDYVTRLDFMAKFTYFKVKGKLTYSIFNEMLEFFQNVFPISKGYKLPPSYYAIKKTFKMIRAWKNFDTKYLDFAKEPRNVRLGLAADGFNPFGNLSQAYIMWPVILMTYNLPPWLCMKESSFMLKMLISSPKSQGKDIDVYLRPLIEDLKVLWDRKGVETIDVASGQKFNMRAMVLWTINDFPAQSSLSGWSGQGYKACPTCNKDTPSVRVLSKTTYVDHRRFLKNPHKWRSSREFNGQTDNKDPPKEFGQDEILAQLDRLPTCLTGKHLSFGDTVKARQDSQRLGIQSGLWLSQTKNGKCLKPQAAYSFTPENRKKFCHFIKGVKLPDGFRSCFKHKLTDNDTNITGLKSHDCHIMMQCLLPYGLQNYLPDKIAKPIIELCSLFKQICSTTLMEDDMLKAQIKVVDILYDLELICHPALFDIMIHLVIHLPLEALEGGPICPRWMFPFERYMKKLKGYVRNKAKLEGSIEVGYVAKEALTFSSHFFEMLPRNLIVLTVMWIPLPQRVSFRCSDRPEIDTYRSQFKSLFPNKDMKEEFLDMFRSQIHQRHVDNDKDPEVSTTSELFTLACGPTWTPISINSCVVDGVRYVVHSRDERRITQNNGICSPGPDREMYYEDDPDIIHFNNSSDLPLSTSLNDLDNATLHIDGQSTEVDVPPDIIDVVDEDDDITDDEDALPHDLADSDNEDLINVDDDGVDKMSADVSRSYGGDGGGEDRPLHTMYPANLSLKEIIDTKGPFPIQLELRDKQTVMPLDDHAAHWSSYIEEVIRGVPLYYPSWLKVLKERKAALITDIGTQFNLRPHMESLDWTEINADIQQHLTYNVEKIRRARPENITASEWDKQSSTTQEYMLLIDTFFVAHTVNGEFIWDEDRRIYEEMRRLEATSTYTDDEINRLDRGGKQQGYIPGVGMVLPARATTSLTGVAGAGTTRRVPTIRTMRMRMAMAILSCVIYGSFPGDMSPGNMCHRGTYFLTGKYVGPTVLLGIVSGEGIPCERSPAKIPRRQVTRETYPQRQVARKSQELSLGKRLNVVLWY
nr:hypothetical protein [Tanacetum cinerariifolium]